MSYKDAEILRDKNGDPIPQLYNIESGKFEPVTNETVTSTKLIGSNVEHDVNVKNGANKFVYENKFDVVDPDGTLEVFRIDKSFEINHLEISFGERSNIDFRMRPKIDGSFHSTGIRHIDPNGKSLIRTTPGSIVSGGIGTWDILAYDESESEFKFRYTGSRFFPEGIILDFRNYATTEERNVAIHLEGLSY